MYRDVFFDSLQETNSLMFFVAPSQQSSFELKGYVEVRCLKSKVHA